MSKKHHTAPKAAEALDELFGGDEGETASQFTAEVVQAIKKAVTANGGSFKTNGQVAQVLVALGHAVAKNDEPDAASIADANITFDDIKERLVKLSLIDRSEADALSMQAESAAAA
jgi:phytoene dehydrogenase-like protein